MNISVPVNNEAEASRKTCRGCSVTKRFVLISVGNLCGHQKNFDWKCFIQTLCVGTVLSDGLFV